MAIEFDPDKDAENRRKHGISLNRAIDFEVLAFLEDDRNDYGEVRFRAWGKMDDAFSCLVFTLRADQMRAISLRRAHLKEIKRYVPSVGRG